MVPILQEPQTTVFDPNRVTYAVVEGIEGEAKGW